MRSLAFLQRHGTTRLNEQNKFRGLSDGPDAQLDEAGIQSAHDAAKYLLTLNQPFSRIICSPLGRTQETAAIIAEYFGLTQLEVDDRLLPLNVGALMGKPKKDHPLGPYLSNQNKRFPNGETINEFETRQKAFANYLLDEIEKAGDSEILIVCHVSNIMFWWNMMTNAHSEEYLGESSDIVEPGGIALVTEHSTIPIYKPNPVKVGLSSDGERDES